MAYTIEIHLPGGAAEIHEVQAPLVTLGSSPVATVRVPESCGFLARHLELFASDEEIRVQVPSGSASKVTFDGCEHTRVRVPFGGEVFVGNVRLRFSRSSRTRRTRSILLFAGVVSLMSVLWGLHGYSSEGESLPNDVPAPPLFSTATNRVCPVSDTGHAERKGLDEQRSAVAKVERSVYVPGDGVDACAHFATAYACFQLAGKYDSAAEIERTLTKWRQRLDEQYTARRLRLRLALEENRPGDALKLVGELQSLLAHQVPGAYRRWLDQLGRQLTSRLTGTDQG